MLPMYIDGNRAGGIADNVGGVVDAAKTDKALLTILVILLVVSVIFAGAAWVLKSMVVPAINDWRSSLAEVVNKSNEARAKLESEAAERELRLEQQRGHNEALRTEQTRAMQASAETMERTARLSAEVTNQQQQVLIDLRRHAEEASAHAERLARHGLVLGMAGGDARPTSGGTRMAGGDARPTEARPGGPWYPGVAGGDARPTEARPTSGGTRGGYGGADGAG